MFYKGVIKIRNWEEEQIINTYKWADGFHKVKMNRLQVILGNGWNWGMLYIFGFGAVIHIPLAILISYLTNSFEPVMDILLFLYFIVGLLLELFCQFQRDKITYNEMIERERQINIYEFIDINS